MTDRPEHDGLCVRGLVVQFPHRTGSARANAVDGVDLDVRPGEVVAVLGHNGCGKSSTSARRRRARAGHRRVGPRGRPARPVGRRAPRLPRRARRAPRISMVFQQVNLVRRLTVLDNVCAGALGRVPVHRSLVPALLPHDVRAEALWCLEQVGLADRALDAAGRLSGGQQQRVAIARALCQRAPVMLADEPTSALDPAAADQVMALLAELTHVQRLADGRRRARPRARAPARRPHRRHGRGPRRPRRRPRHRLARRRRRALPIGTHDDRRRRRRTQERRMTAPTVDLATHGHRPGPDELARVVLPRRPRTPSGRGALGDRGRRRRGARPGLERHRLLDRRARRGLGRAWRGSWPRPSRPTSTGRPSSVPVSRRRSRRCGSGCSAPRCRYRSLSCWRSSPRANTSPASVLYQGSRAILSFLRAVPDVVFALIFVTAVGLGPVLRRARAGRPQHRASWASSGPRRWRRSTPDRPRPCARPAPAGRRSSRTPCCPTVAAAVHRAAALPVRRQRAGLARPRARRRRRDRVPHQPSRSSCSSSTRCSPTSSWSWSWCGSSTGSRRGRASGSADDPHRDGARRCPSTSRVALWYGGGDVRVEDGHRAAARPGRRAGPGAPCHRAAAATGTPSADCARAPTPSVLGHEAVGDVVAIGADGAWTAAGDAVRIGDRVVWSVTVACGACDRCRDGRTAKCRTLRKIGHEPFDTRWPLSGTYGQHVLLPAGTPIARVPDALPDAVRSSRRLRCGNRRRRGSRRPAT